MKRIKKHITKDNMQFGVKFIASLFILALGAFISGAAAAGDKNIYQILAGVYLIANSPKVIDGKFKTVFKP